MKKILVAILVLVPALAFAQNEATVNVGASIGGVIQVTNIADVSFGDITLDDVNVGGDVEISAITGDVTVNELGTVGAQRGQVDIYGAAFNADIEITISGTGYTAADNELVLVGLTPANTLTAILSYAYQGVAAVQDVDGAISGTLNSTGNGVLHIGGTLDIDAEPVNDFYTATLTVSVEYN